MLRKFFLIFNTVRLLNVWFLIVCGYFLIWSFCTSSQNAGYDLLTTASSSMLREVFSIKGAKAIAIRWS